MCWVLVRKLAFSLAAAAARRAAIAGMRAGTPWWGIFALLPPTVALVAAADERYAAISALTAPQQSRGVALRGLAIGKSTLLSMCLPLASIGCINVHVCEGGGGGKGGGGRWEGAVWACTRAGDSFARAFPTSLSSSFSPFLQPLPFCFSVDCSP